MRNSILITIDHGVTWCEEENYYVDWCCHPPPSQPPKTLQPFSFPSPFITLPPTCITSSFFATFFLALKKNSIGAPPANLHQRLPPFFSLSPFISLDLHHMTGLFMHQPIYFSSPSIYSSGNKKTWVRLMVPSSTFTKNPPLSSGWHPPFFFSTFVTPRTTSLSFSALFNLPLFVFFFVCWKIFS